MYFPIHLVLSGAPIKFESSSNKYLAWAGCLGCTDLSAITTFTSNYTHPVHSSVHRATTTTPTQFTHLSTKQQQQHPPSSHICPQSNNNNTHPAHTSVHRATTTPTQFTHLAAEQQHHPPSLHICQQSNDTHPAHTSVHRATTTPIQFTHLSTKQQQHQPSLHIWPQSNNNTHPVQTSVHRTTSA